MSDSSDKPAAQPRKRVDYGTGREALLNAAVRVVARGGLRKLTYRAVAEEAGVTHGLVVHHFGSRDALIEAGPRACGTYQREHECPGTGYGERELSRILPEGATPALTRLVFAAFEGLVLHQLVLDESDVTEAALEELRLLLSRCGGGEQPHLPQTQQSQQGQ